MNDIFKSLHLKNFGPWNDQIIEFHPGVTVLVGESDTGKSAILKGLNFVIDDKTPKSAEGALGFITRPQERGKIGECILKLVSDSKEHEIARRKGKSVNEYQLNDDEPQKANNRTIPAHIEKIINMRSVNYHKQSEPPFLLSDLPSVVARQLAEVIDLQEIELTVSFSSQYVRDNKKLVKTKTEQLESMNEQLKSLDYVQNFKAMVDNLISLQAKFDRVNSKFETTDQIVFNVRELEKQKNDISKIADLSERISQIEQLESEFSEKDNRFSSTVDILAKIDSLTRHGRRNEQLTELAPRLEEINSKIEQLGALRNKRNNVEACVKSFHLKKKENRDLENKIQKLKFELKNMVCPTCGQRIVETDE